MKASRYTAAHQSITFSRRMMLVGGAQAALGGALIARLGYLSIAQNEHYQLLSESNRVQLIIVPPRRGWIVDRAGKPIAINRSDFRVDIIPEQLERPTDTLRTLTQSLKLGPDDVDRIIKEIKASRGYQPVQVAENVPYEQYAAVTVRLPEMPGVQPMRGFSRFYPTGPAVGHLIGYVGAASAKEYEEEKNPLLVTPGFKIGKEGLEKTLEKNLRGQPGGQRVELTARGKLVRELEPKPDRSGQTIQLSIDAGLQDFAARRLGEESGACTILDCQTGDILCMASMPAYDPNSFSDGIGRTEWSMLSQDERRPLVNKTLNALYPPGSTIKPMNSLALQAAGVDPDETIFCPGGYRLGNRFFRCLGRHGTVNMRRAIAKSCNTYFYAMGHRVGYDRIAEMARRTGLGQKFDLPVVSQSYGTVPDSAWKARKYKENRRVVERPDWTASDTLNASIGQGFLILNPLQLAVMAARIASGRNVQPNLLGVHKQPAPLLGIPQEHLDATRGGMWEVVNGDGTAGASRLQVPGIEMCGKTGTAQVRKIVGSQRGQSGDWKYRDHGLFVFFAPYDNPRYAGSVVIEHGLGGARAAAPVAKDVLTFLFDQERAMASLTALEQQWGGTLLERTARRQSQVEEISKANLRRSA
ncbi:penicillin-binding protein 2 [Sphingomonas sp. NSE70-1]|uniref:Penicillin-binding protein 2 n=1 Tax=Sphingomonas caseinilyticus TaxID=2908205 RepID=A0ABT0RR46_9SPHN|nr:penicillin-binding protein 2 [Sphingomonas caseinilyticus]MCL6697386.1 penicillin-binding protein 2 [Sphingomonas caseinilyticus]